jgi:hypothetical protein
MKFKVFEVSKEWLAGVPGAKGVLVGEIEAEDIVDAVCAAKETYPNKNLRVTDVGEEVRKYAIDIDADAPPPDTEALRKMIEEDNDVR